MAFRTKNLAGLRIKGRRDKPTRISEENTTARTRQMAGTREIKGKASTDRGICPKPSRLKSPTGCVTSRMQLGFMVDKNYAGQPLTPKVAIRPKQRDSFILHIKLN